MLEAPERNVPIQGFSSTARLEPTASTRAYEQIPGYLPQDRGIQWGPLLIAGYPKGSFLTMRAHRRASGRSQVLIDELFQPL